MIKQKNSEVKLLTVCTFFVCATLAPCAFGLRSARGSWCTRVGGAAVSFGRLPFLLDNHWRIAAVCLVTSGMVFGPWHKRDESGGDGSFDVPPNGLQLHAAAPLTPSNKRQGEKAPRTEEKKAKGAPTRDNPEIGVQACAAPTPFVLDAAAGGFGATDFLKVRYDGHALTQPHES